MEPPVSMPLEPISNPPLSVTERRRASSASASNSAQGAPRPLPAPISPEEYWKRKAAKYGWRQNTGNYARDHLANERTFLAWFRTSATFFSVGAVISKLTGVRNAVLSGVLLMTLGGLVLLYAPYRYFTVKRLMDAGYFRPNFWIMSSQSNMQGIICLVVLTAVAMASVLILSLIPNAIDLNG